MTKQIAIGLVTATLLAACGPSVYRNSATPIPGYGNAVKENAAVMIIDPQPRLQRRTSTSTWTDGAPASRSNATAPAR